MRRLLGSVGMLPDEEKKKRKKDLPFSDSKISQSFTLQECFVHPLSPTAPLGAFIRLNSIGYRQPAFFNGAVQSMDAKCSWKWGGRKNGLLYIQKTAKLFPNA